MNRFPLRLFLISLFIGLVFAGIAAAISGWFVSLPYAEAFHARTEMGALETVTSYLWLLPLGLGLGLGVMRREWLCLLLAWLCLIFLLRELDLHKLYTAESISSTRYWRSGDIPFLQKLLPATLLLITLAALLGVFRRGRAPFIASLREGRAWLAALGGAFVVAGSAVLLDNVLQMDALEDPRILYCSLLEEALEMMVPALFALAFFLWGMRPAAARESSQRIALSLPFLGRGRREESPL